MNVGPLLQFHYRDNAWWEVRLRKRPLDCDRLWDVWLERPVAALTEPACVNAYGGKLCAVSKRPLTPDEVRRLLRQFREQPKPSKRMRYTLDC